MDRYPVAYIRRSSADEDNPGDVSREAQTAAVMELAHRDGHNGNLRILTDWDRSADPAREARREAFTELLGEIATGRVSAVYAYALDRLYRSMRTFLRLTDAAKAHDVRIVTLREGVLGGDGSPMAQAFGQITAVFSELELNTAKARNKGVADSRRRRGDSLGIAPYGWRHVKVDGVVTRVPDLDHPIGPILDAYRESGTVIAACRRLNAAGVRTVRGNLWQITSLGRVLDANDAERPARNNAGNRRRAPRALFAQLLRCGSPGCGRMLTPNLRRGGYYCSRGKLLPGHGRYWTSTSAIRPWIEAEAAHLRIPGDVAEMRERDEARRTALLAKRGRWIESYAEGLIGKSVRDAKLAAIVRELDHLEAADRLVEIPPAVDWTWPPERVDAVLRALWAEVTLDADLRPVSAEWVVPEWRA